MGRNPRGGLTLGSPGGGVGRRRRRRRGAVPRLAGTRRWRGARLETASPRSRGRHPGRAARARLPRAQMRLGARVRDRGQSLVLGGLRIAAGERSWTSLEGTASPGDRSLPWRVVLLRFRRELGAAQGALLNGPRCRVADCSSIAADGDCATAGRTASPSRTLIACSSVDAEAISGYWGRLALPTLDAPPVAPGLHGRYRRANFRWVPPASVRASLLCRW